MIVSVVATAKYDMAIVLPKSDDHAKKLFVLSTGIAVIVSLLLLITLIFIIYFVSLPENLASAKSSFFLLPVGVLLIGVTQSLHYYFNRKGNFIDLAKGRILRSIGYSFSTITMGIVKPMGFGLALSDSVGYLANNLYLLSKERGILKMIKTPYSEIKSIAKRYSNFPKFLIVSGLFEKGSSQTPILFLSNLFNSTMSAGYFSFAQRIIVTPADLLARAISDVFRQKASYEFNQNGNCSVLFKKTLKRLLIIGIVPFCIGYFIIVDLFTFIFGPDWSVAGEYAKIMMPMFFLQFIVSPLSIVFVVAEKQKYDLLLQVFLFIAVVASFIIGHYYGNEIQLSIKLFTITYCVKYLVEFGLAYKFSLGNN